MENSFILDTDFLFAFFISEDLNHERALLIAGEIGDKNLLISNLVMYEILTLVSRRMDQDIAKSIYNDISYMSLQIIYTTKELEADYFQEFLSYEKKNVSLVDCANLVLAKKFKAKIASFDRFYPKEFLI